MYKIPAKTLFIGKNLVFVTECPSTNTLALEIAYESTANEGTLVITDHQTAGKGQRGNLWEAEPGKNLTFSLILRPKFLAINKQFFLNLVVCLALKDYLKEKTPYTIHIKWPNDILVHGKKISGILIENQLRGSAIQHSVAGIGFNINQQHFVSSSATSLATLTGQDFNLEPELHAMLGFIESRYLQLRQGKYDQLMNEYLEALFGRHERRTFSNDGNNMFEGEIQDLDASGKLRIKVGDGIRAFGIREIRYMA